LKFDTETENEVPKQLTIRTHIRQNPRWQWPPYWKSHFWPQVGHYCIYLCKKLFSL